MDSPSLPWSARPARLHWFSRRHSTCCLALAAAFAGFTARAVIVGPYTPAADTLHLWHLDEAAVPAVDAAPDGTNLLVLAGGATLNNPSFAGFGTALATGATTNAYLAPLTYTGTAADNVALTYADTTSGAFTYEAIIRVDFDPNTFTYAQPLYLVTAENRETGSQRPWQWAILPNGSGGTTFRLRFFAGGSAAPNNATFEIPASGPDALAQGNWYHVAVTFSGGATSGTLKQYWTLLDASRIQANEIGSMTFNVLNPKAAGAPAFQIGNVGRGTSFSAFPGLIDEVRLSKVEKSSTQMMFNSAGVVILSDPVSVTNIIGQPAAFSVVASGTSPSYQWRLAGTNLTGATQSTYTIAAAQPAEAGEYDVVVSNVVNAVTSAPALLVLRTPVNLTWIGSASADWDTALVNWDSNGDAAADAAYTPGDNVRFDANGSAQPTVNLTAPFTPSAVVVNADTDYVFTTATNGGLFSNGGLTKQGLGTLTLDTDNGYTGATVIEAGRLTVGAGDLLGVSATRGSPGAGPITNLAALRFDRVGALTLTNPIAGQGSLVKDNSLNLALLGNNTLSGPITVNRGNLTVGPAGLGGATNVTLNGVGAGTGTSLGLREGVTVAANVTLTSTTSLPDNRVSLISESGTNIVNAAQVLDGAAAVSMNAAGGSLEVNGPVTGPTYTDFFTLRGTASNNVLRSTVTLPSGMLQKVDGNTWTVNATGHSYLLTRMINGTLKLGNNHALATASPLVSGGGVLDLAGFNQTFSGLSNHTSGATTIANSSTTGDSRLSVVTAGNWNFSGVIADSTAGGTRKVALTLAGGSLTLSNANPYSGDTTITSGTLALGGTGSIANSTPITLTTGATLDGSSRDDGTFTLTPGQTLAGNGLVVGNLIVQGTLSPGASLGTLATTANVTLAGTTWMEVDNGAGTNDVLNASGTLTYGGTLVVSNLSATPFAANQAIKLFTAGSYAGAFADLVPATPGSGLKWNTNTLASDGWLRVAMGVAINPTNLTFAVVSGGSQVELSWPADHTGWTLQAQTNALNAGLGPNWFPVSGSDLTNRVFLPMDPTQGSVFYRMVYP